MTRHAIGAASAIALFLAGPALVSRPFANGAAKATPYGGQAAQAPAATAPAAPLPKVFLFATGGTISNKLGGRLTVEELIASIPGLDKRVSAQGEQFANTSSSALTLEQWLDLAKRINARFKSDPELAGVVVTCGTDTLEELAYFLHLTVRDERPVVVVGSMRNPSTLGYEGAANLEDAFLAAAHPQSKGMGTVVVLNDEINSAREVTKTDALSLDTFQSSRYGVLGVVDYAGVAYYRKTIRRHSAQSEFDVTKITALPQVDIVWVYQGATGGVIKAIVDAGAKGLILAGAGAGATSGSQDEGFAYAVTKGVFVVRTTRAGAGRIPPPPPGFRGRAGSPPPLRLVGDDLTPVKARILLMLAMATTSDGWQIQRMFSDTETRVYRERASGNRKSRAVRNPTSTSAQALPSGSLRAPARCAQHTGRETNRSPLARDAHGQFPERPANPRQHVRGLQTAELHSPPGRRQSLHQQREA